METKKPSGGSQVFYTGQDEYTLDPSRRVTLPVKWRSKQNEFWVVPWPVVKRDCLMVVPAPRFQKLLESLGDTSLSDEKSLAVQRAIGGTAQLLSLDKSSRFLLPERLAGMVGIKGSVLFVGMLDKFEIWDPKRYAELRAADEALAAAAVGGMKL